MISGKQIQFYSAAVVMMTAVVVMITGRIRIMMRMMMITELLEQKPARGALGFYRGLQMTLWLVWFMWLPKHTNGRLNILKQPLFSPHTLLLHQDYAAYQAEEVGHTLECTCTMDCLSRTKIGFQRFVLGKFSTRNQVSSSPDNLKIELTPSLDPTEVSV